MTAATGISNSTNAGRLVLAGSCTLDPGSIGAAAREEQTIAVPEAKVGDLVAVQPRDALSAGLVISHARVSADGTISFYLENHSAGAVDQASGTWDWEIRRGNDGIATAG